MKKSVTTLKEHILSHNAISTTQLCHMTFTMWFAETSTEIRIIIQKRGSQLFCWCTTKWNL